MQCSTEFKFIFFFPFLSFSIGLSSFFFIDKLLIHYFLTSYLLLSVFTLI